MLQSEVSVEQQNGWCVFLPTLPPVEAEPGIGGPTFSCLSHVLTPNLSHVAL